MHQHVALMEGCSGVAGAHQLSHPVGLPCPTSPKHLSRRSFPGARPVHDFRNSSALLPRGIAVPVAIVTTEKTIDPGKKNARSTGTLTGPGREKGSSPRAAAPARPVHIEWYKKNAELWCEAQSKDDIQSILQGETEKFIVADFYAGWCSSCKAAFPALCKVAGNPEYTKHFKFVKANIQNRDIAQYIRSHGVRGIPTIIVFAPGGAKLVHFGASFRKMNMVKANLTVISANKGSEFVADPDGYVFPRPGSV